MSDSTSKPDLVIDQLLPTVREYLIKSILANNLENSDISEKQLVTHILSRIEHSLIHYKSIDHEGYVRVRHADEKESLKSKILDEKFSIFDLEFSELISHKDIMESGIWIPDTTKN